MRVRMDRVTLFSAKPELEDHVILGICRWCMMFALGDCCKSLRIWTLLRSYDGMGLGGLFTIFLNPSNRGDFYNYIVGYKLAPILNSLSLAI